MTMDVEVALVKCDMLTGDQIRNLLEDHETINRMFSWILHGEFEIALGVDNVKNFLDIHATDSSNLSSLIQRRAEELVQSEKEDNQLLLLGIAISCLQIFVKHNWTGPFSKDSPSQQLPQSLLSTKNLKDVIFNALMVDSESVYALSQELVFLFVARVILLECRKLFKSCQTSSLWLLRTLIIHQALLDERSPTLKALIEELIDSISKSEPLMTDEKYNFVAIQFHLEASYILHYYYNAVAANEHVQQAVKLTALSIELTGCLGKRTHFQRKEVSQLMLQVQRTKAVPEMCEGVIDRHVDKKSLPNNLPLDDETVMENIKLNEELDTVHVSALEQAIILALCHQHRRMVEGQGNIVTEESMAYITCVLKDAQSWCVQSTALFHRSKWEKDSVRRAQRSMGQLEELVSQCTRDMPPASGRLPLVYAANLPPHWTIQKELASLFEALGAMNAALELYERLQMWEEVIKCYASLGRREKAENLILEQLQIKETPTLYCYLGDVTSDPQHYEKAWELSNNKSARAQRSLARYYLSKLEYERSITHFEKSLEVNPLQIGAWFSYGCAALACSQYDKAARAFRRCVGLENENHEAWNNLATAYIRNNQKPRAFVTLLEAVKWDYENWRIWENIMLVAIDIGEFAETLHCYHRLLDIKHKWTDAEVLGVLVKAVNKNLKDAQGNDAASLRPKLQELMGRVTAAVTTDANIWRHYADLLLGKEEAAQTDRERALQYLQKCHRCSVQTANWERDITKCNDIATQCISITKAYLQYNEKESDSSKACQLLSSARLMLKGVITKIKQKHVDPVSGELHSDVTESCQQLEGQLQFITEATEKTKHA